MTTPPGWYPDPQDPSAQRWWDGSTWTDHVTPATPAAPATGSVHDPYAPTYHPGTPLSPTMAGSASGKSGGAGIAIGIVAVVAVVALAATALFVFRKSSEPQTPTERLAAVCKGIDADKLAAASAVLNDDSESDDLATATDQEITEALDSFAVVFGALGEVFTAAGDVDGYSVYGPMGREWSRTAERVEEISADYAAGDLTKEELEAEITATVMPALFSMFALAGDATGGTGPADINELLDSIPECRATGELTDMS